MTTAQLIYDASLITMGMGSSMLISVIMHEGKEKRRNYGIIFLLMSLILHLLY